MKVHQKLKNNTTGDPAIPLSGIYLKELKAEPQRIRAHKCSQQHYLQEPKGGRKTNVHQPMNLPTQCHLYI